MSRFTSFSTALMRRAFPSAAVFAVGLTLASGEALAQAAASLSEPGPSIQAVDYAPVPAGSVFEVQANADNELNQDMSNACKLNSPITATPPRTRRRS